MVGSHIEELEDYSELDGLIDPERLPNAEFSRCFVHRGDDGHIDGYVFAQPIIVVEPIWVAEHKRGTGVAPRLFGEAIEALQREGTTPAFYCRAERPEIEGYLKRLGMKAAGTAFVMELKREG